MKKRLGLSDKIKKRYEDTFDCDSGVEKLFPGELFRLADHSGYVSVDPSNVKWNYVVNILDEDNKKPKSFTIKNTIINKDNSLDKDLWIAIKMMKYLNIEIGYDDDNMLRECLKFSNATQVLSGKSLPDRAPEQTGFIEFTFPLATRKPRKCKSMIYHDYHIKLGMFDRLDEKEDIDRFMTNPVGINAIQQSKSGKYSFVVVKVNRFSVSLKGMEDEIVAASARVILEGKHALEITMSCKEVRKYFESKGLETLL